METVAALESSGMKYYSNQVKSKTAVVFLHGVPFNSNLWLPVIKLLPDYSCYAFDLKGFGLNANSFELEPKQYNLSAQFAWLEQAIATIESEQLIFVMHGWSGVPATMLAQKLSERIVGLGYFESQVRAVTNPDMLSLPMQAIARELLAKKDLEKWILKDNGYNNMLFEIATISESTKIKNTFKQQGKEPACRAAILQYLYELPLGFKHTKIVEAIQMNSAFLERSKVAKCIMYATPGFMTPIATVAWAKDNLKNLTLLDLGEALHCAPMTMPNDFANQLRTWLQTLII